jgi:hypothetical protein
VVPHSHPCPFHMMKLHEHLGESNAYGMLVALRMFGGKGSPTSKGKCSISGERWGETVVSENQGC